MQREISAILGKGKVVLRETGRSVTPYGGLAVLAEYLKKIGYAEQVRRTMPIESKSPNAIPPVEIYTAFLLSVLAGARRFAHTSLLRGDRGLHALLGIKRFPTDDTVRNLFKKFTQRLVYEFYSELWGWQIARLPERAGGYSLDLDSTVFERYGRQEGALKGHNPRKHGRPSHHPLLAVLAEAHFVLHGWLRSGNCGTARGVVEFLKEALVQLPDSQSIRVVRADSGFFDDKLLEFLEVRELPYIVVARLTSWLKREAARVRDWRQLDENYAVGEFQLRLSTWTKARRFVVVRERIREQKGAAGRKLIDVPGYTFRLFVTSRREVPEEIWRDYNKRAEMENRIAELKYDLAADDFCLREFFATEAAFLAILMLFNLLGEMQRMSGMKQYRRPATLRAQVFLCGAILGRSGHRQVLHLSQNWGGLGKRNSLMNEILAYAFPTSPKLTSTA
ncbi:MAG: IS1380 family transposase [Acidobacteriota bacterium]|nr:IS1380 family transposase [Acidobacteriota bacterium]